MTKADKEKKISNIKLLITDACYDVRDFANNLLITEEESQRMRIVRQIEDKTKDIRKYYKDIEKINEEAETDYSRRKDDTANNPFGSNAFGKTNFTNPF